jgi:phosphohistidine phosphatase
MKFLNILRHGESEPYHQSGDFQRELTPFGRNQLAFLASKIVQKDIVVESILCSSAIRTRETCQLILDKVSIPKVSYRDQLYECDLMKLLHELKQMESQVNHLLLIGHNPGLSALVSYLTGEFFLSMNPGDFVQLSLEIDDWNFLSQDIASISTILR